MLLVKLVYTGCWEKNEVSFLGQPVEYDKKDMKSIVDCNTQYQREKKIKINEKYKEFAKLALLRQEKNCSSIINFHGFGLSLDWLCDDPLTDVLSHRIELLVANENIDESCCRLHWDRWISGSLLDVGDPATVDETTVDHVARDHSLCEFPDFDIMLCLEPVKPSAMLGHFLLVQRRTQTVVEAGLVSCSKAKIRISYWFIGVLVEELGIIYNIRK